MNFRFSNKRSNSWKAQVLILSENSYFIGYTLKDPSEIDEKIRMVYLDMKENKNINQSQSVISLDSEFIDDNLSLRKDAGLLLPENRGMLTGKRKGKLSKKNLEEENDELFGRESRRRRRTTIKIEEKKNMYK